MPSRDLDILVEDANGAPVLAVECKSIGLSTETESHLLRRASDFGQLPFAMLVDPQQIRIYRVSDNRNGHPVPAIVLPTESTFQHYDAAFGQGRIFEHTLITLSGAWLRDVMDHWRSPKAPGEDELQRVGLLPRIAGGWTRQEAGSNGAALLRD